MAKTIDEIVKEGQKKYMSADNVSARKKKMARKCNRGRCKQYKLDMFKARTAKMGLPKGK